MAGANTLEELAGYLGYTGAPVNTFPDSVRHYNELCYRGVDSEFGKDTKAMIPVDEPPFYGEAGKLEFGSAWYRPPPEGARGGPLR